MVGQLDDLGRHGKPPLERKKRLPASRRCTVDAITQADNPRQQLVFPKFLDSTFRAVRYVPVAAGGRALSRLALRLR
jgi:hypothetical protein